MPEAQNLYNERTRLPCSTPSGIPVCRKVVIPKIKLHQSLWVPKLEAPKDGDINHKDPKELLILGLGTIARDPYVHGVFGAPSNSKNQKHSSERMPLFPGRGAGTKLPQAFYPQALYYMHNTYTRKLTYVNSLCVFVMIG